MPNHLNPVRRIEAKRILTHLFAHEQFDADHFVDILAGVMIDTPEACAVPHEDASLAEASLTIAQRIHETLRGNRDCFLRSASGSVSRGALEAQAAACTRALADLQQLVGNGLIEPGDKEV